MPIPHRTSGIIKASLKTGDRSPPAGLSNRPSFNIDWLVRPGFVEGGGPDLVRGLVFRTAETELRANAEIDVVHGFEGIDQLLGIELWPGSLQRLDQDGCRNVALERGVVGRLARGVFGQRGLVLENGAGITRRGRYTLGDDDA